MTFGEKLKLLRLSRGLTQEELACRVGTKKQSISRYENSDREPGIRTAQALADALGVSLPELSGAQNAPLPDNVLPMPVMRRVPLIGTIACGLPIFAEENVEGEVSVPEHVTADFALRCKGDSMINARIHDGDVVYIRQQDTVENGQIAAVLIGEEATLKRFNYKAATRTLILSPANDAYEPLVFVGEQISEVRVLGRAVAFTGLIH